MKLIKRRLPRGRRGLKCVPAVLLRDAEGVASREGGVD